MGYYTNEFADVQATIGQALGGRCRMSEVHGGFMVFVWVDGRFSTFSKFYENPSVDAILIDYQNEAVDFQAQEKVYNQYGCE